MNIEVCETEEKIAVSFSFSRTGPVQILARSFSGRIEIDIFAENSDFSDMFSRFREELDTQLKKNNKKIVFHLYDMRETLQKLEEYRLGGGFGKKVDYTV